MRERNELTGPEEAPHPAEREEDADGPPPTSLNEDIRARIARPHKGDVGREGTNEEIFQGSKMREME
ncbi:MAG TPA: hypothetical protein VHX60_16275 [Acidobacteriaceae bacterium]|jgi:hypothetical protein|nr:hypothetical protein [Acidobacteriaceae bacterium]